MAEPAPSGGVSLPRLVAWKVLRSVAAGAFADVALAREFRRHGNRLGAADRALTMELAYGSIRQRRLLDRWLDHCGAVPAQQQPPTLRWLLHLGLYQLLFAQRIPEAVAVSSSVELAKAHGLGAPGRCGQRPSCVPLCVAASGRRSRHCRSSLSPAWPPGTPCRTGWQPCCCNGCRRRRPWSLRH